MGARFEDSGLCSLHYTRDPDTCSPITTQMNPEYSNKYHSVDNCHISGDAPAKNCSRMNRLFEDGLTSPFSELLLVGMKCIVCLEGLEGQRLGNVENICILAKLIHHR